MENGAPKIATDCDRLCWQELNEDLNNLDSGPLKAMLTQPESSGIKYKNAAEGCLKRSLSPDVAFTLLAQDWLLNLKELPRRFSLNLPLN